MRVKQSGFGGKQLMIKTKDRGGKGVGLNHKTEERVGGTFFLDVCVCLPVSFRGIFFLSFFLCVQHFQQHPPPEVGGTGVESMLTLPLPTLSAGAGGPTRFLISAAIVMNACSTLVAFLADVSRKGMPRESAYSLAVVQSTTFFVVRSLLFPTSNLLTDSQA